VLRKIEGVFMKWFKHISDSLDDPFIYDLLVEFGAEGYLVFFGVIEKYSREFSPENGWKLVINPSYFRQKFLISSAKIKKILSKIHKWDIEYKDDKVIIFIPKFTELLDEWSRRKLGSHSGVTPKILKTDKDKDKELDKDIYIGKSPRKVFKEPSLQEVSTYCKERNNSINPQTFIDHYTGNGWMVGKNKMKDWKAVIRTWETRGGNNGSGNATFTRKIRTERDAINEAACDEADRIARDYYAKHASTDGNT
jgi:hypothetical protein